MLYEVITTKQLQVLSRKELAQPFGLKIVAQELQRFLQGHEPQPARVMGIINANADSFYPLSRFDANAALDAAQKMVEAGAAMIDRNNFV